jgi:hypothetical protein
MKGIAQIERLLILGSSADRRYSSFKTEKELSKPLGWLVYLLPSILHIDVPIHTWRVEERCSYIRMVGVHRQPGG